MQFGWSRRWPDGNWTVQRAGEFPESHRKRFTQAVKGMDLMECEMLFICPTCHRLGAPTCSIGNIVCGGVTGMELNR